MNLRIAFAIAVVALIVGSGVARADDAQTQQVKAAYAAWDAAFNKGDAKGVAALYTEDSLLLPPSHDVIKGPTSLN
jgi:ketosteroid isomerase-like protein